MAFKKLSISESFGYPSSVPFNYERVQIDQQPQNASTLWYIKPETIDLFKYTKTPKFESVALDMTYSKHLTAIDGL